MVWERAVSRAVASDNAVVSEPCRQGSRCEWLQATAASKSC
jgi:hypothetical protein